MMAEVERTQFVAWLPSTAVLWRAEVLRQRGFDEFFDGYSYLEDLDFSYSIGQQGRLAVVADAGYYHFPSPAGRVSQRQFGRVEVRNRLHFVRKAGLSVPRCYMGIGVRIAMSVASAAIRFDSAMLARAVGNLEYLIARTGGILPSKATHANR